MELIADNLNLIFVLALSGAFAGLIAGMFGIGGGVVIVPALYAVFRSFNIADDVAMKTAIATSLATIVVTSLRSSFAHYKRGAVDVRVLKNWIPWIIPGALLGAVLASYLPGQWLIIGFGIFVILIALQMGFGNSDWRIAEQMPRGFSKVLLAGFIGISSAMAGIGGGVVGVILMTLCGKPIHRAVGTAAGFGVAIGLPAALMFMVFGWQINGLVPFSIGFVNLPGFLAISVLTVALAPVGAGLAHSLSPIILRRMFAVLLVVTGLLMLRDGFTF
ncbi:MAG: sulfite exporter TauE/SafE family protein [Robiginitomaculum sp.]|nr:sulfite exporter TauE/SafE family protein [Robiginitomaculum sp.]